MCLVFGKGRVKILKQFKYMDSLKVLLLSLTMIFAFGLVAIAQEVSPEVTEAVNLDETIEAEDLEISEPNILPDSPFYFLKNWGRSIQSFFAFNPVSKAELRLRFANDKLIEAKKLV
jgi:hypothetical protein